MRKLLVILMAVIVCSWTGVSCAEGDKIGYISLKNILDNYEKVKMGEEQLLKEAEKKDEQRKTLVNDIKKMREKIDLMEDSQKESKQAEMEGKIKELQDLTYQMRTALRQQRDEKFREIMEEIKSVVDEYGQSKGYSMIIDDTLLLYKKDALDVTEEIIKKLNQRYKR